MSNQIRPGVRGGRDQFNWNQVKEDKQRLNYLGSSIHGVPDKFKRGRPETFWYAKEEKTITKVSEKSEIVEVQAKERQMMEKLLGGGDKLRRRKIEVPKENTKDEVIEKDVHRKPPVMDNFLTSERRVSDLRKEPGNSFYRKKEKVNCAQMKRRNQRNDFEISSKYRDRRDYNRDYEHINSRFNRRSRSRSSSRPRSCTRSRV